MPRGIYPRKPKESNMAKAKTNPVIEHVNGVKVEDPVPVPPLTQMMRMWLETQQRANKLQRMYELAKEAKEHLSEKEFKKVEQSVLNDFQIEVMDLSTGVAHAAAVDNQDDDEDTF